MPHRPPAAIGMPLEAVDTPALLIDLDAFEANLARMAAAVAGGGVRLRAHAKTHKCAVIARRQMALGAVGACCQKVSEAEALVHAGVPDVLVSNQVVGRRKLERLAALAAEARIGVCVDHATVVDDLSAAASAAGREIGVLVEVDVGAGRCGVAPGPEAVALARRVADAPGLRFDGLQAYQGRAQHLRTPTEREAAIAAASRHVRDTLEGLDAAGLSCPTVAGAGTGTFRLEMASGLWNELQAGSYVFMDADYGRNLDDGGRPVDEFRQALHLWAGVISRPGRGRAVLDVGLKSVSVDSGLPLLADHPDWEAVGVSDEHLVVRIPDGARGPAVGERLRLVPGHCDPTVNLHDWYVAVRGNRVEALWPIVARGAIW